ncbi:fungal-specific transcription factor domain-containing protein [Aspergillus cavernicola]|uniref:Fungal-specific transcription factor domain-containing protein n=1 Tax=Aspergillus cavernicola TaxID=176166 RepID=A0ABR4IYR1_9EURO
MEQTISPRSCYRCNKKKIRCNRISPCQRCAQANVECISPPPGQARRRRKRPLKAELTTRLKLLEEKVQRLNNEGSSPDRSPLDPTRGSIGTEEKQCGKLLVGETTNRYVNHQALNSLLDQVAELRGVLDSPSSSEEDNSPSPQPGLAATRSSGAAFLGYRSLAHSLRSYHLSPVDSQVLWDTYEKNISPLIPILHKPSTRNLISNASANPESLDENSEALVFAVYFAALTSMEPDDCASQLREAHPDLIQHYRFATEQAVARAGFLHTHSLTVLQALVLLLLCVRGPGDTQLVWVMTAVVNRLGQRLGLHRDGSHSGLSPFQIEMRRRLWWQIYLLDTGSSEYNAMGAQMQEIDHDTKLPLNINDEDISPDSPDFPNEHSNFTELTFFLTRCDFTVMLRQFQKRAPLLSIEEREQAMSELSSTLEHRRLQYSTEVVEFGHLLETNENTTQWAWFFETYEQWHAFAFLLSEICTRPISPLTDRAWRVADLVYRRWKGGRFEDSGVLWKSASRLMKRAATIWTQKQKQSQDENTNETGIWIELGLPPPPLYSHSF